MLTPLPALAAAFLLMIPLAPAAENATLAALVTEGFAAELGYHGEDDRPRYPGAPTVYGQQNHPGIAQPGQYGDQPYGSYEQPRSFGSAGDPYSVPDDRGDVRP